MSDSNATYLGGHGYPTMIRTDSGHGATQGFVLGGIGLLVLLFFFWAMIRNRGGVDDITVGSRETAVDAKLNALNLITAIKTNGACPMQQAKDSVKLDNIEETISRMFTAMNAYAFAQSQANQNIFNHTTSVGQKLFDQAQNISFFNQIHGVTALAGQRPLEPCGHARSRGFSGGIYGSEVAIGRGNNIGDGNASNGGVINPPILA